MTSQFGSPGFNDLILCQFLKFVTLSHAVALVQPFRFKKEEKNKKTMLAIL